MSSSPETVTESAKVESSASMSLLEAVHRLTAEQLSSSGSDLPSAEEMLAAVERLRTAPPVDHWNRGLLGGLRSSRPKVVEATAKAAVDRLERLERAEDQDTLVEAILDACFLNLSGRPRRPEREETGDETLRANAFEHAAARLVRELGRFLRERPLALEHHRSRLLSRARSIAHLAGRGHLAESVVEFQHLLGEGERSDQRTAGLLLDARRADLYTSPLSSEPTLLAYLARDRRLPVEEAGQELFAAYRQLLQAQSKERSRRALLAAMDNLIAWLDQLPQDGAAREALLGEVQRARVRVPWEELDSRLCRHLEIHRELVAPDLGEADLLSLLRRRYDAAESEDVLIRGLELLRRLPLLRLRSAEICDFVLGHGRRRRSAAVWRAMLELVGALLTGLSDFVLTRDALGRSEQRYNRARRRLLAHDRDFRELLHRLATDDELEISHDAEVAAGVRELAWRTLLRCLPENRVELLREGLVELGDRFFYATLEEAAATRQRELWEVALGRWDELVSEELPAEERRRRVNALADVFRQTRNFEAVQDGGEEAEGEDRLGPMIRLALDDPDEGVRRDAERAVVDAGYQLELRREQERRQILRLRDQLTDTNRRIVELEDEIAALTHDSTEAQVARAEHTFEVQGHLVQRDLLNTDGWLTTSEVQIDLEEVRAALQAALAAAAAELVLLHALRHRMEREHRAAQEIHGAIQTLVRQHEQLEAEIARREEEQRRAERRAAEAESDRARLESRRSGLSPPSAPVNRGDPERYQREVAQYQNDQARYQSQVRDFGNRITALGGEIRSCRAAIQSCRQAIAQARARWKRLGHRIREERSRIDAIRRRIAELDREFWARQATCREIRREIARLQAEVRRIEARFESERSSQRSRMNANTARIGDEQRHLERLRGEFHDLSERLNARGDDLDRRRTRGQRLVQAIDSGRQSYERVAEKADQQSAHADASGLAQQRATEQERREEQESLALYVEGVERALRQPPPRRRRLKPGG